MKKTPKIKKRIGQSSSIVVAIIIAVFLALLIGGITVSILFPKNDDSGSGNGSSSYEDVHAQIPGHGFLQQWQTDAQSHWRICKYKTCEEIIDKADHTWGEGTVLSTPTESTDGQTKYVCTVCGRSKTDTVSIKDDASADNTPDNSGTNNTPTTDTADKWPESINISDFENFSFSQDVTSPYGEIERIDRTFFCFTKDKATSNTGVQFTNGDVEGGTYTEYTGNDITAKSKEITDVVFAILSDKNKFTEQTNESDINQPPRWFAATESMPVTVKTLGTSENITLNNISVTFSSSKLSSLSFEYLDGDVTKKVSWSFYHYGTTSFDFPEYPADN